MSFVLVYDIPSMKRTERRRIQRELNRIRAELVQDSLWRLDRINPLIEIAKRIRKIGGKASILEEKLIF